MKLKVSQFSSPDLCEFWTGPYTTLSVEITKNQFEAMKSKIEQDQARKEHIYQLFKDNCVQYAMSIAAIAGIQFPTKLALSELLISSQKLKMAKNTFDESKWVPSIIKSVVKYGWVMGINWVSLILGAGMVDREVNWQRIRAHPLGQARPERLLFGSSLYQ